MEEGRRQARRRAVFLLYQADVTDVDVEKVLKRAAGADGLLEGYAAELVRGVERQKAQLDSVLDRQLTGWSLDRLGSLERSILRVAAYEILEDPTTPGPVAVTEAVELAKRYVSEEARVLINGVLGAVIEGAD